ncbi:MAG: RNA methyltransferase [Flavobacteriaceae bacterium]|nr:MAG: RNA methyltransferase [Flavobacteriaceae bacterium]
MRKLKTIELERKSLDQFKESPKIPLVVILDNLRSLHNVGSVFRTADAFRVKKLILVGITATPPNKEIQKTALGATQSVEWEYFKDIQDTINSLKKENICLISVEQTTNSQTLESLQLDKEKTYGLIFGNEVSGVNQWAIDQSDFCVEIPQEGTKHSLNVSVCSGIVLWEFYKQLR